jgi:hypothetical protein
MMRDARATGVYKGAADAIPRGNASGAVPV